MSSHTTWSVEDPAWMNFGCQTLSTLWFFLIIIIRFKQGATKIITNIKRRTHGSCHAMSLLHQHNIKLTNKHTRTSHIDAGIVITPQCVGEAAINYTNSSKLDEIQ